MVFGLSKNFTIALIVAVVFSIGLKDWTAFLWIVGVFAIVKIIWRILTL